MRTDWSYLPNSGDRRLSGVSNIGLISGQFSTFQIASDPALRISGVTETSDTATAYPTVSTQTAAYNNLNQLANLSGQALTYDANGNLLSDGTRTFSWDAENRLIGVGYPGQPGKATDYIYDGLSRRVGILRTPAGGGGALSTSYIFCGLGLCQARDAMNNPIREYLAEGEFIPGSPGAALLLRSRSDRIGPPGLCKREQCSGLSPTTRMAIRSSQRLR